MNWILANSFYILETIAICSFALSGLVLARKKNFDPVGLTVIAFVTALGGGTVRDLVLDNHPLYWIRHSEYCWLIFILSLIFYFGIRFEIKEKWLFVTDAMGLALFTVTSAHMAISQNYPLIIVAILATCSATFGGLIRDTLCQEIPMIFQKVSLYASVSFFGAVVYFIMFTLGVDVRVSAYSAASFVFFSRMLALFFQIRFR